MDGHAAFAAAHLALVTSEEAARAENEQEDEKEKEAAAAAAAAEADKKRKSKKKKSYTKKDREAKARQLDELLRQSQVFSDILTESTDVLGRAGSGADGKALGEHNLILAEQPKCMVGGTMHDYQLEGLRWMQEICTQGVSGILADEMGLGKTIQTISLMAWLREQEHYGPHLIVAPLSTLSNWINEFAKWVPSIPVVMYHGDPKQRTQIRETKLFPNIINRRPNKRFPIVCTSYEIILRDLAHLSRIPWEFIIIDEGHRMKNFNAKLFTALRSIHTETQTRFLITGTPLQNTLQELWSLLHFLLPKIFDDWQTFEIWFDFSDDLADEEGTRGFIDDQEKQGYVRKIHRILQPLLLRRVKADVAAYLPKKREYVLFAPLTREQAELYRVIQDSGTDTRAFLENKVVERLTNAKNTPVPSREASPAPMKGRASARKGKAKAQSKAKVAVVESPVKTLPVRSSPRKQGGAASAPAAPVVNAFDRMMPKKAGAKASKAIPAASAPAPAETPGAKRKQPPTTEEPESKSAKSSRHSTPSLGGSRASSIRGRVSGRGGRVKYAEADDDEDDKLDDYEFEAKLAQEMVDSEGSSPSAADQSADEVQRLETLAAAKKEISRKKLGNPLMQLRLVCNSPHNFYDPWDPAAGGAPVDETIVTASGKMLLLDRLLPELFTRGHKVLIFSQFKTQLDILQDYCGLRGWQACRIDGSVAQPDRAWQIAEFNNDPELRIFLLSTRAGGQGINLAAADTVILFDSDWNPQQDLQAQDRAHRIGQTRPVIVYRLATKGTVEEQLLLNADAKRRLEKLVIKKGGFKSMGQKLDDGADETLLDQETLQSLLLRDGQVYEMTGKEEVLSDADLDVLCDRSDESYARAALGDGNADAYQVVETGVNGITRAGTSQATQS